MNQNTTMNQNTIVHTVNNIAGVDVARIIDNRLIQEIMGDPELRVIASATWRTLETVPDADIRRARFIFGDVYENHGDLELTMRDAVGPLVFVRLRRAAVNVVTLTVAARRPEDARAEIAAWRKKLPKAPETDSNIVNMQFWFMSDDGASSRTRRLVAPTWEEIKGNYTAQNGMRDQIGALMDLKPSASGQLLLWHGEPGTGKTYALRALARAWRRWCSFSYITDPEKLFGSRADYLMQTLLSSSDDDDDDDDDLRVIGGRWRLLILEDAGELLVPDARAQVGQGLSRLLNLVDGMLGQGLRVLVLVTTNEPLRKLHPAIARPGRCVSNIEFGPLSLAEGRKWFIDHGGDPAQAETLLSADMTLANLYARAEAREVGGERRVEVGFGSSR